MKLRLAVIFGSRTCEHDVSIISGMQAAQNADPNEYEVSVIYIARDGKWYVGDKLNDINFYKNFKPSEVTRVLPAGENGRLVLYRHPEERRSLFAGKERVLLEADVVMPVMHGMNGEDGTLEGMLELWNIPYTASGVLGSSVGMDKIAMKQMFRGCGFPVLPDTWTDRSEWNTARENVFERVEMLLGYPVYVKPANLGSSIGISRADDREGLITAMEVALSYDRRVLIERGVLALQEVNCAALGYSGNVDVSMTEMPMRWADFLTFDEKYVSGGKHGSKGMMSLKRQMPAPVGDEMNERIEKLTASAFRALDCKGVIRVDYIIDGDTNELYMGEINTIPGSLAFYLFEGKGISFKTLIDRMVECALTASADRNANVFSYQSTILNGVGRGAKGAKGSKR